MTDKEQLEHFLKGNASEEESKQLLDHMKMHPEALDELLPEEEWNAYKNSYHNTATGEPLYSNIREAIHRKKRIAKKLITWSSVAAAVLILVSGIGYFSAQKKDNPTIASVAVPLQETVQKNSTTATLTITLPDQTVVSLSPGSELRYAPDYNAVKRDVYLIGKATFEVAKNKQKPFTVFCHAISTTALGTRFSVDGNAKNTSVMLYEGKVVVKKIQDEKLATYLLPGDAVAFNSSKNQFEKMSSDMAAQSAPVTSGMIAVATADKESKETHETKPVALADSSDANINAEAFTRFQNESLKTVLDKLADIYHVEINYPTEISFSTNVYFSVDTSQSVENILKNIAALNNLELKKEGDNKFYFSKE